MSSDDLTPRADHASGNGHSHLASVSELFPRSGVGPADLPRAVRPVHPADGSRAPAVSIAAAPPADAVVVREVRRVVADRLAAQLRVGLVAEGAERRELARGLVASELANRARARVQAGEVP